MISFAGKEIATLPDWWSIAKAASKQGLPTKSMVRLEFDLPTDQTSLAMEIKSVADSDDPIAPVAKQVLKNLTSEG